MEDPDLPHLEHLARQMDRALRIPGLGVRVGWDSILGLVPVLGDLLALAPALYIVERARRRGAPGHLLARMGLNIGIDTVIGAIPVVGDLFDIGWKANTRNVALLRRHLEAQSKRGGPKTAPLNRLDQP